MQPNGYDVVVIGGGAIGLSLAWKLRRQGASVALLERGAFSPDPCIPTSRGQATWASAGMLAPLAEAGGPGPFLDLGLASLNLYPEFVQDLSEASGQEVMLQGPGTVRLALTPDELPALQAEYQFQQGLGLGLRWLGPDQLAALEPAATPEICGGVLSPQEKHVPPRQLHRALELAARNTGVSLLEHTTAESFQVMEHCVVGIETASGSIPCGQVVVAGGAWSAEVGRKLNLDIPVRPVRGQVVALRCSMLLSHTLYTHQGYLVPRTDGQIIVGATMDESAFSSSPTLEGVQTLLGVATTLVPSLAHAQFEAAWAGLRPGSPDGLPILGMAPGWENVHLATGHFRNGILLTPITAELMAGWVLDRRNDKHLQSTSIERFMHSS